MRNVKIIVAVMLAACFATGFVLAQDQKGTYSSSGCSSSSSCSGEKATSCSSSSENCPVTGVSQGDCPATTTKMSPALAQYVASKHGKKSDSCCGSCDTAAVQFATLTPASSKGECDKSSCDKGSCDSSACSSLMAQTQCPAIKKILKKDIAMDFKGKRVFFNSFVAFDIFRSSHANDAGTKANQGISLVSADMKGIASSSSACPIGDCKDKNVTVIMDNNNIFFVHNGKPDAMKKMMKVTQASAGTNAKKSDCCGTCGGTCTDAKK